MLLEQLSRLLQVSASELRALMAQGTQPAIETADSRAIVVRYLNHLQSISKAPLDNNEGDVLLIERQRLMHVQANRLELIRDSLKGYEVLLFEALESWLNLSQAIRAGLNAIPSRCTPIVTGLTLTTVKELLNHECENIHRQSGESWLQLTTTTRRLQPSARQSTPAQSTDTGCMGG